MVFVDIGQIRKNCSKIQKKLIQTIIGIKNLGTRDIVAKWLFRASSVLLSSFVYQL